MIELEKYIKIIIIVLIIGFLSLSLQLWYQARAIGELREDIETMKVKVEAVRELLFRIGSA